MSQAIGYIAPSRTASRVADQILDRYLKTKPGSPEAVRLLQESRAAARENIWDFPNGPDHRSAGTKSLKDLAADELDGVCEMYQRGETIIAICQKYDTNHNAVYRLLKLRQIERKHPGRGRRANVDVGTIYRLFDSGVSIKGIARRLKCHHGTVKSRLVERVR